MKKSGNILVLVVVLVLWMTGCSPSSAEIASTVESQVALDVQATIALLPSVTPVATLTPMASFTPQATYTPYPTFTPLPTYTPFPTIEPTPEDTATVVPTATATATSAPVIQPTDPPATSVPTSNLTIMKTELAKMLNNLDRYRASIIRRGETSRYQNGISGYKDVDCVDNIAARELVISTVSLDVSQDIPEVQNAYAIYLDVARRFGENTEGWNQACLEAIANGTPEKWMDAFQRESLSVQIDDLKRPLNDINNQLMVLDQ